MSDDNTALREIVIQPVSGWQISDIKEFKEYRDLFFFLVWRDIKVMYAQTILGFFWAILQPLIQIIIFTIVFGKIAQLNTDGIPYFLYSTVAIIPWTYMSQTMQQSSQSMIQYQGVLGKIYFPRLLFPITPVLSRLVDFFISILIVVAVIAYYKVSISWTVLLIPLFIAMMVMTSAAIGMWLSSLAIRFRDVKHAMTFIVRMLIYTAPIVYSASSIPGKYRFFYSLNPIVGVIEGFRACFLGLAVPWNYVWPGMVSTVVLFVLSAIYFKRMEQVFADVI
jgi:lipopolysaccharide transport system permease protein